MEFSEEQLIGEYGFTAPQKVLVDVGAHQGGLSTIMARKGWRVIAFEPEKENRAEFERNHAPFPQVTCLPYAVFEISGEMLPFYVSEDHWGIHSLKPFHETHRLAYEVETVRLDEVLQKLSIDQVSALKIDVEGADFPALKGFDFQRYRPEVVMLEFMDARSLPHFGYTHHDVCAYMKERGYVPFVSEWSPVASYARKGEPALPETSCCWLGCRRYPLSHEPSWGNLIFVPEKDSLKFASTLTRYLRKSRALAILEKGAALVRTVPGGGALIGVVKSVLGMGGSGDR